MPRVIVDRDFEHVVSPEETTRYPAGWTGDMPAKLARRLVSSRAGRIDVGGDAEAPAAPEGGASE